MRFALIAVTVGAAVFLLTVAAVFGVIKVAEDCDFFIKDDNREHRTRRKADADPNVRDRKD